MKLRIRWGRFLAASSAFISVCSVAFGATANLSYENLQRLNTPLNQTDANNSFTLNLKSDKNLSDIDYYIEADLRIFLNDNRDINFSLAEAYQQFEFLGNKMTVGRKVLDWNPGEKYWYLSRLNSNQGFYLLGKKQEGLTGLLVERKISKNLKVSLFGSYLFIPQLNPEMKVEDGRFVSTSEWASLPPQFADLGGGTVVPINYTLNKPEVKDVIFKKSFGINIDYNWESGGITGFAIYKPESSLRANASYKGNLGLVNINSADVTANPVVNHHGVYGAYIQQALNQNTKASLGFDITDPNAEFGDDFVPLKNVSDEELSEIEKQISIIRPSYDYESYLYSSVETRNKGITASLNYVRLMSDNERGSSDFSSDSVKWKSALGTYIQYQFNDKLSTHFDYKYDLERKDEVMWVQALYNFNRSTSLALGAELIKAPSSESYWTVYRANDTIYTKLNFLF